MSVEVKICGLTNRDDALAALELGADFLGFVLYAPSPRSVTSLRLSEIVEELGPTVKTVGVLVNESRAKAEALARACGLYAVQIHGDERADAFAGFPRLVWRAVKAAGDAWQPAPDEWPAARYVVDAAVPGAYGGTGATADWNAAARLAAQRPVMLAGGLTPANVAQAVRAVRPLGVDVASGVESAPGRKDRAKMQRFIEAAKAALD